MALTSATRVAAAGCRWRSSPSGPSTLQRVEAGDAGVGIGIYAAVLQALGLLDGLGQIADIGTDAVGQALAAADLPKHVHLKRPADPSRDG